ncbi:acyltransferase family protein [Actinomadura rifamycini]|uniref:acyltransferase family protein n=1 Tax=Actinomadura rifamycini TaxID=31962 RepID=UPI000A058BA3|nr:acyltransferase [Actinomadura rifamycini]
MTTGERVARTAVPPQIDGHQAPLDGVRAVAALAVLAVHVASSAGTITRGEGAGWLFNGGQVGVAIFFTLSGLLLYRPWAVAALDGRPAPRAGTYFAKRALRILPAYWVLIAVYMATAGRDHIGDPLTWASLLTFTQIYVPDPWWSSDLGPAHLGQLWSLSVEVAFYVTLPITAAVLNWVVRRARTADVGGIAKRLLCAIGVYGALSLPFTALAYFPERNSQMGVWLPRYFIWFALGMALAVVTAWARQDERRPVAALCNAVADSWKACWVAAAMLFAVAATPATGPLSLSEPGGLWTSVLHMLLFGACALAFMAPVALAPPEHPAMRAALGNPVMRWLGRVSYGLFLWQMIIIVAWYEALDRTFRGSVLTDLPLLALASTAAAALSYYLVERPGQAVQRRLLGRPS